MKKISEKELENLIKNFRLRTFTPIHAGKNHFGLEFLEQAYQYDFSEIDQLDDLHNPQGLILESERKASKLFKVKKTFFSINGASACLIASCLALRNEPNQKLKALVPVNAHISLLSGLLLAEITPVWYQPIWDSKWGVYRELDFKNLEYLLEKNRVCAVFVVSPTYEGQQMNLVKLTKLIDSFNLKQEQKIKLVVDQAHGAHLDLLNSNKNKADLIIHSAHKTLGTLNQTALLHLNSERISVQKVRRSLNLVQTTSPSFLLLFNLIDCIQSFQRSLSLLKLQFRESLKLKKRLQRKYDFNFLSNHDPSRLVIDFNQRNMKQINQILKRQRLESEIEGENWSLFLLPIGKNSLELENSFSQALSQIQRLKQDRRTRNQYPKPSIKNYSQDLRGSFFSGAYFSYKCPPGIFSDSINH